MAYQIKYAYTSHIGKIRTNNEDNFWCMETMLPVENQGVDGVKSGCADTGAFPALAVFDGMGGESCGETAAFLAAEEFGKYYGQEKGRLKQEPQAFLEQVCRSMNAAVCRYCEENHIHSMGTTLALLQFAGDGMYACNLGDSRIYQSVNGHFHQISTDHVIGGNVFGKAPLTQYLGIMEEQMTLEPSVKKMEYQDGVRCLICSDGMTDMLSDGEIADILTREIPVEETVEILLERALKKGGRDNITIILCEVSEVADKGFFRTLAARWKTFIGGVQ